MKKLLSLIFLVFIACFSQAQTDLTQSQMIRELEGIIKHKEISKFTENGIVKISLSKQQKKLIQEIILEINKILIRRNVKQFILNLDNKIFVSGVVGEDYVYTKKQVQKELSQKSSLYSAFFKKVKNYQMIPNKKFPESSYYQVLIRKLIEQKSVNLYIYKNTDHVTKIVYYGFQLISKKNKDAICSIGFKLVRKKTGVSFVITGFSSNSM